LIQIVLQWKDKRRCGSDILNDTKETPCPKMPLSEAINAYEVSQDWIQPLSLDLSLITALDITERERRTSCTQLDQQDKA
jgi:hypothetical protein